ncbi:hypothetical protein K2X89_17060 [Myxococcota bacterium]|nr:hypothetical protein [Myxococcota bacterium]
MIVTFTLVKKRPHISIDAFLARWVAHTERFDLKDHPYITKNRLMLLQGDSPYVGMAENHWPDLASLEATSAFYRDTDAGRAHWADLVTFMDIDNSPTVVVTHEADVTAAETRLTRFFG